MRRLEDVDWTSVTFLDLGAGVGASLRSAEQQIGGRGVGVESDEAKVREAQAAGLDVVLGDVFDIPSSVTVDYVVFDNVLEHLPSPDDVERALGLARRVAREFVYIRHPSFEDEAYLTELGLKQFWADWSNHPSHVLLADFMRAFRRLRFASWTIHPVMRADGSDHPTILPLSAPADQHHYDPAEHGAKSSVAFDRPVYYAWDLVAACSAKSVTLDYPQDPERSDRRPRIVVSPERGVDVIVAERDRLRRRRSVRMANAVGAFRRAKGIPERRDAVRDMWAALADR